jgi:hypothetical protein
MLLLILFLTWDSLRHGLLPRTISPTGHFIAHSSVGLSSRILEYFLPAVSSSWLDEAPLKIRLPRSFLTLVQYAHKIRNGTRFYWK